MSRRLLATTSRRGPGLLLNPSRHAALTPCRLVCRPFAPRRLSSSSSSAAASSRVGILPHDVGGDPSSFGTLESSIENPDELADWELRCHSLFAVLATRGHCSTDGLRRAIESLAPNQYNAWTYYEKWAAGMVILLEEAGIISSQELSKSLFGEQHNCADDCEPMFHRDEFVRVKQYRQGVEWKRPHIRVPGYIYGARGTIERVCGVHGDPSFLAFGLDAPQVRLYRVRFKMEDLWPEQGKSDDVIEVEIYEPWLELSDGKPGYDYSGPLFDHSTKGADCTDHTHDHRSHRHEDRHLVEKRAAKLEVEPRPGKELFSALVNVVFEKGIVSPAEINTMVERLTMAGQNLHGASLVARAWTDPQFEERLLNDPSSAASELGISTSNPNAPTILTVVKNTDDTHNLVVCTLCSCYPSGLLGIAPSWYKSKEYRSRAVREPRELLAEFGTTLPKGCRIRVHDSTADHRYVVLPRRPKATEGVSEDQLRGLVTRDSMIGVSIPSV